MTTEIEPKRGSVIDSSALLERFGGSKEILLQIVDVYFENNSEMIQSIEDAIESGDHEQIRKSAHSLKGAVANFGYDPATNSARALEFLGRDQGDHDEIRSTFSELRRQLTVLSGGLEDIKLEFAAKTT